MMRTTLPFLTLVLAAVAQAAPLRLHVDAGRPGHEVSPLLHGLFFEDINYGADGGLYAELVPNRSFENREAMFGWTVEPRGTSAEASVVADNPLHPNNPHYLRLVGKPGGDGFGLATRGYEGIPVKAGAEYRFAVHARAPQGGSLRIALEDEAGKAIAQATVGPLAPQWARYTAMLASSAPAANARLVVLASGTGRVDLDMVSLFPKDTFKQRENGLRADLVQMLADMKPAFMRFPGGCIVEGKDLANAYRWKDTIGPVWERKQNWNRWMDSMREAPAPQYYQTYGLGFFEFFQLCDDLGMEPLPVLNCGMSCQFQDKQLVPLSQLDPWVQDALDLVEFANGPAASPWGAKRAAMGHPAPFGLKYLGVGNEQWDEQYFERYAIFHKALKAKYPDLVIVTTAGPGVDDQWWNLAFRKFRSGTPAALVDEHYYRPPEWFLAQHQRYDSYDRNGPRIFAGEFAAHDQGKRNTLRAALAEASFMTGLLRNSDVVTMASYAPLLARHGFVQWTPDLIWFDKDRAYGSPSYHVQALFARNRPDVVVPVTVDAGNAARSGRFGVGTWLSQAEFKDVKVTAPDGKVLFQSDFSRGADGWETHGGSWAAREGALRQDAGGENVRAFIQEGAWGDCTLSLKARKLGGDEGFLVIFQSANTDRPDWWNLGGWGNTAHGLELDGTTQARVPGKIETGRWYDIRIETCGPQVRCLLDGKEVHRAQRTATPSLFVSAGLDRKARELVLHVANPFAQEKAVELEIAGCQPGAAPAKAIVLTSTSPDDENTLDNPAKVAPKETTVALAGPRPTHTFPPHSLTVLRIPVAGK